MRLRLNPLILIVLLILTNVFIVNAQSLEMTSGAGNPTGNGSSVSNQVITLQENTDDTGGTTFAAFTPTTTVTIRLQNQQYTLPTTQMSTGTGMAFGTTQNTGGILAQPEGLFSLMNLFSSPSNGNFTSRPTVSAGSGITVGTNRAVRLFVSSRPLYNASSSISGRYYYGDLVITFNRPVNNPMLHFVGLGGTSGNNTLGITSEYELSSASAAQMSLLEVSGSSEFNATSTAVLNSASTLGGNTGSGAASGTVRVVGENITSITFQVYMRSDNRSGGVWGNTNIHNGDSVMIGVSTEKPMSVSGNVFNDPDAGNVNNSSGTTNTVPSGMYANLIDSNNKVVASTSVATGGAYSFSGIFPATYTMVLSTTQGTQGAVAPVASLPSGWSNAGEFNGTPNTGNDGTANGISATFTVGTSNVTNINFGIRQNSPDLTIAKSHTGDFTRGSTGTYTITVTNSGTAASSGTITVTDTLPSGLSVNGGAVGGITEGGTNAANWTCNSNAATPQVITCTSTTAIAISGTSVFNFAVNVATTAAASVTNSVAVSGGNEATANNGNNSATDPTTTIGGVPNVGLVKSCTSPSNCDSAPQLPGTDISYRIEFTNSGGSGASNLRIVDGIPTNMDYKIGTAAVSAGISFTIEFSDNYDPLNPTLATWTYTPASQGGGASVGYDRLVKAIRWSANATIPNTSPNNTGNVSFVAKIR